jgi:hypothetical protein
VIRPKGIRRFLEPDLRPAGQADGSHVLAKLRLLLAHRAGPAPHRPIDKGLAGVSGMDLRLLYVEYLAHDDRQNVNFLFRLH